MENKKVTITDFAEWLGLSVDAIRMAKTLVDVSDPDGAYTHLEDMGEFEAAEAVSAIWFDYGSLSLAISAYKEDRGLSEGKTTWVLNKNELKSIISGIIKENHSKASNK